MMSTKKFSFIVTFFCILTFSGQLLADMCFSEMLSDRQLLAEQPRSGRAVKGKVKQIFTSSSGVVRILFKPQGGWTPNPDGSSNSIKFTDEPIELTFNYFLESKPEMFPYVMSLLLISYKDDKYIRMYFNDRDTFAVHLIEDR